MVFIYDAVILGEGIRGTQRSLAISLQEVAVDEEEPLLASAEDNQQ